MDLNALVVADPQAWLRWWKGPIKRFEEISLEAVGGYEILILAPEDVKYLKSCTEVIGWKKAGLLSKTRVMLATYKGRHIWSPENDPFVQYWVVHARSEILVLDSERLVFVPLCLAPPLPHLVPGDDGYLFMGGRKWREPEIGIAAMSASGYPGRVITDFAPEGHFPRVQIRREKIPKDEYSAVMARARLVLVPLKQTPVSHGHVDVVTSILLGKPVLVTAGSSCDDYVQHGVNGLLVRDNSVEAWTEAIEDAWDRADDFAAAAREFAPRYHVSKYAEYIYEIASSGGAPA